MLFFTALIFLLFPKLVFAQAQVKINDFCDTCDPEWVDLKNIGSTVVSLDKWNLLNRNGVKLALSGTFDSNEILRFTKTKGWLKDGEGKIILINGIGETIDEVIYPLPTSTPTSTPVPTDTPIPIETPIVTPTDVPPTGEPTLTPTLTPKFSISIISVKDPINLGELFPVDYFVANALPNTEYCVKVFGGNESDSDFLTYNDTDYLSYTHTWTDFPKITIDEFGQYIGKINAKTKDNAAVGIYNIKIKLALNCISSKTIISNIKNIYVNSGPTSTPTPTDTPKPTSTPKNTPTPKSPKIPKATKTPKPTSIPKIIQKSKQKISKSTGFIPPQISLSPTAEITLTTPVEAPKSNLISFLFLGLGGIFLLAPLLIV